MNSHSFSTEIAQQYGVNEALLLQHIYFWFQKNRANNKNYFDDNWWTYNTMSAFQNIFPYFTEKQIRYILQKLKEHDLIVTGNYNQQRQDRTLWYSLTEKGVCLFEKSILQNCQKHFTKLENANDKIGKCNIYTDVNTDVNTDIEKNILKKEINLMESHNIKTSNITNHSLELHPIENEVTVVKHRNNLESITEHSVLESFVEAGIKVFGDGQNGFGKYINEMADLFAKDDIINELKRKDIGFRNEIKQCCIENNVNIDQLTNFFTNEIGKKAINSFRYFFYQNGNKTNWILSELTNLNQLISNGYDNAKGATRSENSVFRANQGSGYGIAQDDRNFESKSVFLPFKGGTTFERPEDALADFRREQAAIKAKKR